MQFIFAPLEGVTTFLYRNAHRQFFSGIDRYYAPFVSPTSTKRLTAKEMRDLLPENNRDISLVPQVLTNNAEYLLFTAEKLRKMGYDAINLNLGCPSRTVVTKKKGSGFLSDPSMLYDFLQSVFRRKQFPLSVKARIGVLDEAEYPKLLEIFRAFPFSEFILHPRLQIDQYKNTPRMTAFDAALQDAPWPVVYNGDIFTERAFHAFYDAYPSVRSVMIGRGLIANPALVRQLRGGDALTKDELYAFCERLFSEYTALYMGDARNAMYRMKELWFYMGTLFQGAERLSKNILKAAKPVEYASAVDRLFLEKPFLPKSELGYHPR